MTQLVAGGSARRTGRGEFEGKQNGVRWKCQQIDKFLCRKERSADIEEPGRVMLDPLTEIGVGVLVPIVVSRRQLMMDILRHGKWRNGEQEQSQADRHSTLKEAWQTPYGSVWNHCGRATYHRHLCLSNN